MKPIAIVAWVLVALGGVLAVAGLPEYGRYAFWIGIAMEVLIGLAAAVSRDRRGPIPA